MRIPRRKQYPPARRTRNETEPQQIRFVNILNCGSIFAGCRRNCIQSDRSSAEFHNHCRQHVSVNGVKPVSFYGRTGGVVPTVKDILNYLSGIKEGK